MQKQNLTDALSKINVNSYVARTFRSNAAAINIHYEKDETRYPNN